MRAEMLARVSAEDPTDILRALKRGIKPCECLTEGHCREGRQRVQRPCGDREDLVGAEYVRGE